ncbi:transcriptional regulator family: Fungal Specific TF [Trichoderma aggressivum f. europaeum]|uniref:Transcriptional regulator family: Fungal Specific TF n=1 Tax=Trichoderma aggressivum f. europaeum TaxID=173218 RepID=A0AAE1IK96_9HYPO|nr:transcriptional regulator family: Fungal Specific TF [Trichoderma aggressivum f. europaeum]
MAPKRRRTGCINCRNRRVKCDESRPYAQLPDPEAALPSIEPQPPIVTDEVIDLVLKYQSGIGAWMDVLDHSSNYRRQVTRRAASSALLMYSICALSAKQMSLVGEHSVWEPVAGRFYGQSLRLLIHDLNQLDARYDEVFVATILLCSYELLANPGPDYRKHLEGVSSLLRSHCLSSITTDLDKASFWIYARHDVAMALINYCPTLIAAREWPDAMSGSNLEEDATGNQILWLLAKVIELRFAPPGSIPDDCQQNLRETGTEVDKWWDNLPSTSRGLSSGEVSEDGLSQLWFCVQSAG